MLPLPQFHDDERLKQVVMLLRSAVRLADHLADRASLNTPRARVAGSSTTLSTVSSSALRIHPSNA